MIEIDGVIVEEGDIVYDKEGNTYTLGIQCGDSFHIHPFPNKTGKRYHARLSELRLPNRPIEDGQTITL